MKKLVSLLLAALMLLSLSPMAIAEGHEVTFVFTKAGFEPESEDNSIHQFINETTGITMNHIAPSGANYAEQISIMLASGANDIDMFKLSNAQFNKMYDYGDQGALLDLAPYLEEYMPHVLEVIPQTVLDNMKVDGHLRLRRLRLAGTDGQCLMSPPDMVDGRLPVTLYNFGGALANLLTAALALALYGPARRVPLLAAFLLFLAVIGGFTAAMNGIPLRLGNIDNDGRNALSLGRDPAALRAFWVQMKVAEAQARGLRLREMPEDWFSMPGDEALQNAMTAAQGVLVCNRLVDEGRLAEADRAIAHLLAGSRGLPGLYRGLLVCDRVTVELLGKSARRCWRNS